MVTKKIFLSSVFVLILLAGCQKEKNLSIFSSSKKTSSVSNFTTKNTEEAIQLIIDTVPISDNTIKNKIHKWLLNNKLDGTFVNKKGQTINFDFNNLTSVTYNGEEGMAIVARQIGFASNNMQGNYSFIFFFNIENQIVNSMVLNTWKSNNLIKVSYFTPFNELLFKVNIHSNGTINFIDKSVGQDVVDCINEAYTQHGWASAWAIVQTAFIPETAAAIALDCVLKATLN